MPENINNSPAFGYEQYKKEQYIEPEKNVIFTHEKFKCQYCGQEWEMEISKQKHESWCYENPNSRRFKTYPKKEEKKKEESPLLNVFVKGYTMDEVKEIVKEFNLTDKQIAEYVRGEKKR